MIDRLERCSKIGIDHNFSVVAICSADCVYVTQCVSKDARRIVACSTQAEVSRALSVDPQLIKVRDPNGEPMQRRWGTPWAWGYVTQGFSSS